MTAVSREKAPARYVAPVLPPDESFILYRGYYSQIVAQRVRAAPGSPPSRAISRVRAVETGSTPPRPSLSAADGASITAAKVRADLTSFIDAVVVGCSVDPQVILIAALLFERIFERHPHLTVTALTSRRLVLVCLLMASKLYCDANYNNKYWSNKSGFAVRELNVMEVELCRFLDFNFHVSEEEFQVAHKAAMRQSVHEALFGNEPVPMGKRRVV